jgi:hypothetical protein
MRTCTQTSVAVILELRLGGTDGVELHAQPLHLALALLQRRDAQPQVDVLVLEAPPLLLRRFKFANDGAASAPSHSAASVGAAS